MFQFKQGTQKGKEARITKKPKKQKEGKKESGSAIEAENKKKPGPAFPPSLFIFAGEPGAQTCPRTQPPGPISHTEGTAMRCHATPCYAMLQCDSMPANRSDRQQYDWSVPPGGKMTSEEAQNQPAARIFASLNLTPSRSFPKFQSLSQGS